MKAIILAAGEGVRMRPLTNDKPKPLVEVAGKPILTHIFDALPEAITELVVVVGYLGNHIRAEYGSSYKGKPITYVDQVERGTLGALRSCKKLLGDNEKFLVMCADDIFGAADLRTALEKGECALIVAEVPDPRPFGVVELSVDGSIKAIEEKPIEPKSNLVSTGTWVLDTRIFDYPVPQQPNGEYYLPHAVTCMIAGGHTVHAVQASLWIPIGYPEDIAKAEEYFLRQRQQCDKTIPA